MENTQTQKQPDISPELQHALTALNLRISDLLQQTNTTIQVLIKENQQLKDKIQELQTPTNTKTE